MLNPRQINPIQVAAINALTISLLVGLANYFFIRSWWIALLSFVVLFIISYLLIRYFTERFIYRHIKLIYKFISQTKATRDVSIRRFLGPTSVGSRTISTIPPFLL